MAMTDYLNDMPAQGNRKVVLVGTGFVGMSMAYTREFDSCLHFFTNQIAQNVDYINAFEFFCCQICEI